MSENDVIFKNSGVVNGYAYVDLGLPSGLKWATCNVGATNPWEYGNYFAWGETTPKSIYDWSTYLNGNITRYDDWGTYNDLPRFITDIAGTPYDAARVNMGGSWRMPTVAELDELIDNCYCEWTDCYNGKGVKGYIVYKAKDPREKGKRKDHPRCWITPEIKLRPLPILLLPERTMKMEVQKWSVSPYLLSDAHIFLPSAGFHGESGLMRANCNGYYWSSNVEYRERRKACNLEFQPNYMYGIRSVCNLGIRCVGQSVRGVAE